MHFFCIFLALAGASTSTSTSTTDESSRVRGWALFDVQTRVENVEDHLDQINERLEHWEMLQRKNAIRTEVDELKKTVFNLLIASYNDTVTEASINKGDITFVVAAGTGATIIVVLGAILVALICRCQGRRNINTVRDDIEMNDFPSKEAEQEEPIESVEPESVIEPAPRSVFYIGGTAARPISLNIVRGFELPAPVASTESL